MVKVNKQAFANVKVAACLFAIISVQNVFSFILEGYCKVFESFGKMTF